ncbi:MAG TPA: T9SS type A sorting domain-containing protein [Bacteroidales bacterium]|nr:T9SS type A sorting domain-containing protein [Bacteroidales bacterium]
MKKLYLLFVLVFLFAAGNAQFSLTYKTHGILAGDAHDYTLTKLVDQGPAGAVQTWDFSRLTSDEKQSSLTSHMLNAVYLKSGGDIPRANTVIEEYGNKFFFRADENALEQYGLITKNNMVISYEKPFVKMKYPFSFGDSYKGDFSGTLKSGSVTRNIQGKYSVSADGYGKLLLPGGVELNNTLRVKTVRKNLYGSNSWVSTTTFRWYVENVRYPVLVIIRQDTPNQSNIIKTAFFTHAASLMNATDEKLNELNLHGDELSVYPNPFIRELHVDYSLNTAGEVSIELYDMAGKKIRTYLDNESQTAGYHTYTISSNDIEAGNGTYYLRIKLGDKTFTKKVISIE